MRQLYLFKLYPTNVDLYAGAYRSYSKANAKLILSQLDRFGQNNPSIFTTERPFIMAKNGYSNAMEFVNCTLNTEQDDAFTKWYTSKDHAADAAIEQAFVALAETKLMLNALKEMRELYK